jgi:hypothetical protein
VSRHLSSPHFNRLVLLAYHEIDGVWHLDLPSGNGHGTADSS